MDNRRTLVDTSVIIDFLRKKHKDRSLLWSIKASDVCFISSMKLFELLSGAKTPRHVEDIRKITKWMTSLPFDDDIANVAASIFQELTQNNVIIEFRDIFIAATAKVHNFRVAKLNTEHFGRIAGLELFPLAGTGK